LSESDFPGGLWTPPQAAPAIPWRIIERSLVLPQSWPDPHKIRSRIQEGPRRAAVAVVLWGNDSGAKKILLVQRGFSAPQHPGEIAFPGGMTEREDHDLRWTARRELFEELGVRDHLWEIGCFPDGVAKAHTRFTPVLFRWEAPEPSWELGSELFDALLLPLQPLLEAPWSTQILDHQGLALEIPRLELQQAPLWGATAFVLKAWLDVLGKIVEEETPL
jgi:8-oxo-dGTP pyrophosphatase MutT (NUDIX family)